MGILAGIVALATSTPAQAGLLSSIAKWASRLERAVPKAAKPLEEIAPKAAKPLEEIAPAGSLIGAEVTAKAGASGEGAEFVGVESFVDDFPDDKAGAGEFLDHLSHAGHVGKDAREFEEKEKDEEKP